MQVRLSTCISITMLKKLLKDEIPLFLVENVSRSVPTVSSSAPAVSRSVQLFNHLVATSPRDFLRSQSYYCCFHFLLDYYTAKNVYLIQ